MSLTIIQFLFSCFLYCFVPSIPVNSVLVSCNIDFFLNSNLQIKPVFGQNQPSPMRATSTASTGDPWIADPQNVNSCNLTN